MILNCSLHPLVAVISISNTGFSQITKFPERFQVHGNQVCKLCEAAFIFLTEVTLISIGELDQAPVCALPVSQGCRKPTSHRWVLSGFAPKALPGGMGFQFCLR